MSHDISMQSVDKVFEDRQTRVSFLENPYHIKTDQEYAELALLKDQIYDWTMIKRYIANKNYRMNLLEKHELLNIFAKIKRKTGVMLITNKRELKGCNNEAHELIILRGVMAYIGASIAVSIEN